VALETALTMTIDEPDPAVWERRETELRQALSRIGPVNQIAADEFRRLEERQAFLSKQLDDLVRSGKALRKVADAIDKKMRAKFKIAFDEVNSHLNEVFQELFPGGSAGLVLVESDSGDEEPGVDIQAQPHGKRLQSLTLLSGGERSLVGLALLFALHYTRPSPFYILDEVEAALDDANLRRFMKLLEKLKTRTQFLIVTHQRRTMELADTIYGVSMQADGVSRVISQKLRGENSDERTTEDLVAAAVGRSDQDQE
jgi:chromosome segregation protein